MSLTQWFPFRFNRKSEKDQSSSAVPVRRAPLSNATPSIPPTPFGLMREMLSDSLLDDPFGGFGKLDRWFGDHSPLRFQPSVDVVDRGQTIEMTVELPGMKKDDVTISVTDETLTLEGEKRVESESKEDGCYRIERAYGTFRRVLPLPAEVDRDHIDATFHNGVLKISLPKTGEALRARRVSIQ